MKRTTFLLTLLLWGVFVTTSAAQISPAPGVSVKDEGTLKGRSAVIDCVGSGVVCDVVGGVMTVTGNGVGTGLAEPAGDGIVVRSGAGNTVNRELVGTTGNVVCTNGDGVAGNPTCDVGSTIVQTDQANTYGAGLQDLSAATVTLPTPFTLGAVSVLPTGTELNFVDGVTSAIQAQIDGKQASLGFTAENAANKNATNGYAGLSSGKVAIGQLQEVLGLADLSDVTAKKGNSTTVQMQTGATSTDDCAKFDANGNVVSAGAACGAGGGTPDAHATSHQNGGSDEVATATPGVNAIPKADGGGTLGDGWFPAAITRDTELTAHAALTNPHGATTANTADTIPLRDAAGALAVKFPIVTVATLPACTGDSAETRYTVSDGDTAADCTIGSGSTTARCICNGAEWSAESAASGETIQGIYGNSGSNPTLTAGANGLVLKGFDSLTTSWQFCDLTETQCEYKYFDASGVLQTTHKLPMDLVVKPYTDKVAGFITSANLPSLTFTPAGVGTVDTSLAPAGAGTITANRTSCTGTDYLLFDGSCAAPTTGGGGDASTNTATSVDSEIALFSSTGGKTLKRATGTGIGRLASGVLSAAELSGDVSTSGSNVVTITGLNAAKIGGGGVSTAEFDFLATITSNVQTQIDAKAPLVSPTFTTPNIGEATATRILLDTNGVSIDTDGDGALSITGQSLQNDENLTINFDDVANTVTWTSTTLVDTLDMSAFHVLVAAETYDATGWDGDTAAPQKDAVRDVLETKAPLASPTFTGTVTMPTPFTLGAVSVLPTGTELNFVDGVTSAIQTQIDAKSPTASPTFTGTVTMPTPFTLGAVSVLPTGTELNFVDGVTSAIQTQIDGKLPLAGGVLTGEVTVDDLGLEFTPGDALTTCSSFSATGGGIFYDDSENIFKKCQNNTLSDLDTVGSGVSGLTTGTLPKAASSSTLEDSAIVEDADSINLGKALELADPGDNARGMSSLDNSASCADPTSGFTGLCSIGGEWFLRDTGGTSRELLSTAGGDYGDVSCTTGTCTVDSAAISLAKMANLAQDQFIGRTTGSTGVPETATITSAARTVLDDTTVGAMVDTLGGASALGTGGLVRGTSPAITTPTIASFANANHTHQDAAGGGTLAESALATTDVTTNNATAAKHGFLPKLSNIATEFLNGAGAWAVPAGSGYATIDDEDTPLTQRTTLNFAGAGISCADDTTQTTCTVAGGTGLTSLASQTGATQTITRGVGIAGTSATDDHSFTFDATELTNITWSAGGSASIVHTFDVSGTDTAVTYGNGVVNVSTGTLQQAGVNVVTESGTQTLANKTLTTPTITSLANTITKPIWVPADVTDGTQCAAPAMVTINSGPKVWTVICTDNDASTIYGMVPMPTAWNAGTVTFTHSYIQAAADTGVLNGDIACQARSHGEAPSSTYGTEVAIDDAAVTGSNANDMTTSGAVTCAGTGLAGGDILYFRYQVDATATTTAVATLHHLGFFIRYGVTALSE